MSDIQTIVIGDSANAALLTKCVNNFAALQVDFASATAPASPLAHQIWVDTSGSPVVVKRRNAANSAWVVQSPDVSVAGGGLLPLTGGTMSGAIAMGATKVTGLANGTASGDAINKGQADARVHVATCYVGTLSATDNKYLVVVGTGTWTIVDVGIVSETGVASHATDLWTFQVRNLTASVNLRSSAKSTNGAAITADTYYALGLDQNLSPSSGAVLQIQITKGGSAGPLTETLAVVRYTIAT